MNGAAMYASVRPNGSEQDEVIAQHAPLVKRIAYHLMSRLPASVQADDLIQAGMIGLLEAARNYDATQGASFETYAGIRVRGAMLDEIRKGDWVPRSVHRKARQMAEAVRAIEHKHGRDARDHEIAEAMELDLNAYYKVLQDVSGHRVLSFEDVGVDEDAMSTLTADKSTNPDEGLLREDFKRCLAEGISGLPERERLVLTLYYDEELNLREIGAVIGVSESRVSQIHSQALIRLKARMANWLGKD
ncbi:RNA polymerase sigma factor FliA [Gammaproteobacteria bacterium AH-315-C21]|nr:RNA polymerase sigma factor FliA [Gammaproteobacteria bacterium]MBN4078454.1 RNA polymerase sigma factor FliA [Gammaproteobacteria bacterium AH-315-C21]PCH62716.1 MAG: RNA polymerase sigma factor FliA [Gammaproteobacteria bacterium]PCH64161.1 MAG: RNA polymerase sigma factor FliA [Gammaproteobacteria bacterium]